MEKVLTDLDRVNIAKQEYELGSQLDTLVKIMSQDKVLPIGKVAHVQDGGKETGEQIYTITPNGTLDKPEDVKEVTVLFKGSTAPFGGDDWKTDWFKNDIPIASKLLLKKFGSQSVSHKQGTKQLEQSAHLLKEVMNKYPNAKISVYGHSLGSMNAQYAIAELDDNQIYRVQGAWIYNGPNLYSILTDKQKEQVDKIKGVVNNYVDSKDKIGIGYPKEGSDNAVGIVKIVDSKAVSGGSWVANFTNQHIWGGYQYNQDGSLKLAEDKFAYKENYLLFLIRMLQSYVIIIKINACSYDKQRKNNDMIKIFDTHTHLNVENFEGKIDEEINLASELGVTKMNVVGFDQDTISKSLELSSQYAQVYSTIGWHPTEAGSYDDNIESMIISHLENPKVIALGEIGLDYYWMEDPKDIQIEVFKRQIELSKEYNLPFVVHTRDALEDTYEVIKESGVGPFGGIMHSFSGSLEMAQKFIDLGMMISFSGVVTFKKALDVQEAARELPLDKILVETDAPYLAPVPKRGRENKTAYTRYVVEKIAELRGITVEEVAEATYQNAVRIFRLDEKN